MQSIIIAYAKADDAKKIRTALARSGIAVSAVTASGAQALAKAEMLENGVILCGYRLRDMLCCDLAENLPAGFRMIVITSPMHLTEISPSAKIAVLTTPLRVRELLQELERTSGSVPRRRKPDSADHARDEDEKRRIAEAKAVLMERNHMTEPEAHRYLQKCAMDSGCRMAETASKVLLLSAKIVREEGQS